MAPRGRPRKHVCNNCNKNFTSGRALGGHMSCHWRNVEQRKSSLSPPAIVVDLHVSLLSDEKPLLPSSGMQCQMHSKVLSTCKSPREHTRKHNEKKVVTKPTEEAAGLMEALPIADGDNTMLSPPVKRKRSKRETPVLNLDEMDAAATLLLLSEHSDKTSASEGCCGGDKDMNILVHNGFEGVKLDASDHLLVRSDEFKKPKSERSSAYDDYSGQCKKDNSLFLNVPQPETNVIPNAHEKDITSVPNAPEDSAYEDCFGHSLIPSFPKKDANLIPNVSEKDTTLILNVPKKFNYSISSVPKEVELSVFYHELASDAELCKPRTYNSDLSAAVKANSHQCNACGKSFGSGQALGGHMRCHHPRGSRRHQGAADFPDSVMIKERKQKLQLDSRCLISEFICIGLKSEPEAWRGPWGTHCSLSQCWCSLLSELIQ